MCYAYATFLFVALCIVPEGKAATPYTFSEIAFPGVSYTEPFGINDSGQLVGVYQDASTTFHGFLLSGGTYTSIDVPPAFGAVGGPSGGTYAIGINSSGDIVGNYFTCSVPNGYGCRHSYLLSNGVFTALPDAPGSMPGTTAAWSINSSGQIVGWYVDPCFCKTHGFLFSGGNYTTIDQPGFSTTYVTGGINDSGQVVGSSTQCWGCGTSQGFSLTNGVFTTIDVPVSAAYTELAGINNAGDVAGRYYNGQLHAFVLSAGTFTYIDHPAATQGTAIEGQGINSARQLVGIYISSDGLVHGFLATPAPTYSICLLYDSTKAAKSGATIPIKLQLCDSSGANLSSASITLHATSLNLASSNVSGAVQDAGNANPDNDFRYDPTLAGYIFNLKTTGLATGTYNLNFQASGDLATYTAPFQVK